MIGIGFAVYLVNVPFEMKLQPDIEYKFYALLLMWECILLQGPAKTFKSSCMNIVIISTCIFGVLLVQFYGAYVVASLLTNAPHTITNLNILNESSIKLGIQDNSWNRELFENPRSNLEQDIAQKVFMNKNKTVLNMWNGLKRITYGEFAFHMDINEGYFTLKSMSLKLCFFFG